MTFILFRGVAQPPTRQIFPYNIYIYMYKLYICIYIYIYVIYIYIYINDSSYPFATSDKSRRTLAGAAGAAKTWGFCRRFDRQQKVLMARRTRPDWGELAGNTHVIEATTNSTYLHTYTHKYIYIHRYICDFDIHM